MIAVKVLLEHFLQLSSSEINAQSVIEKGHLAHGAVVLSKYILPRMTHRGSGRVNHLPLNSQASILQDSRSGWVPLEAGLQCSLLL